MSCDPNTRILFHPTIVPPAPGNHPPGAVEPLPQGVMLLPQGVLYITPFPPAPQAPATTVSNIDNFVRLTQFGPEGQITVSTVPGSTRIGVGDHTTVFEQGNAPLPPTYQAMQSATRIPLGKH